MTDEHTDPPRLPDGTIISDEMADEWAREAEAGYDIDPSDLRPGPGRKSLAGGSGKSPRVNVRLTTSVYEQLRLLAAEAGESISTLAREAIERDLRRRSRRR